jgi:hypothetical protein
MPDTKITALTALTAADPANDMMPIVDVSDTSMAASGTTKRISINNILACSPSATLASLNVTGSSIPANGLYLPTTNTLEFSANSLAQYRIAPLGVFSWYDGAGSTRMTLNSTGLGVGTASPAFKLDVSGSAGSGIRFTGNSVSTVMGETGGFGLLGTTTNHNLGLYTNGSVKATIDTSGNVGISVTPSAWNATYNVLDIGQNGSISGRTSTNNTIDIVSNGFRNSGGTWVYKLATSSAAARYQVDGGSGAHLWYIGVAGTAGNTIAGFSTASMTLDSAGNLIWSPSATPPTLVTNGNLTVNATSNTNLRFSYRGSDGTTRVANITLA